MGQVIILKHDGFKDIAELKGPALLYFIFEHELDPLVSLRCGNFWWGFIVELLKVNVMIHCSDGDNFDLACKRFDVLKSMATKNHKGDA